jgi:5-methylcytosine-specific restriction endonuclease McrA
MAIRGEMNPSKRPEVRAKISAALRGKSKSRAHIEKIAAFNRGKKHSEEHKRKIRESAQRGAERYNWKGGVSKNKAHKAMLEMARKIRKLGNGGSHTLGEWETLKAQYNWTCPCCLRQEPEIKLTVDHIIPVVRGGSDNIENIQPLCGSCNSRKNSKTVLFAKPT